MKKAFSEEKKREILSSRPGQAVIAGLNGKIRKIIEDNNIPERYS